jgi:hypothetical protein
MIEKSGFRLLFFAYNLIALFSIACFVQHIDAGLKVNYYFCICKFKIYLFCINRKQLVYETIQIINGTAYMLQCGLFQGSG